MFSPGSYHRYHRSQASERNIKKNFASAISSQQISSKNSCELINLPWKSFSKISLSKLTLNYRSRHSCIKLKNSTFRKQKALNIFKAISVPSLFISMDWFYFIFTLFTLYFKKEWAVSIIVPMKRISVLIARALFLYNSMMATLSF